MLPSIEHRALILPIPLPKQRPGQFADDITDLLLERAAFAGSKAQQPAIRINPLAPDQAPMNVVGGHAGFLSELPLIE